MLTFSVKAAENDECVSTDYIALVLIDGLVVINAIYHVPCKGKFVDERKMPIWTTYKLLIKQWTTSFLYNKHTTNLQAGFWSRGFPCPVEPVLKRMVS